MDILSSGHFQSHYFLPYQKVRAVVLGLMGPSCCCHGRPLQLAAISYCASSASRDNTGHLHIILSFSTLYLLPFMIFTPILSSFFPSPALHPLRREAFDAPVAAGSGTGAGSTLSSRSTAPVLDEVPARFQRHMPSAEEIAIISVGVTDQFFRCRLASSQVAHPTLHPAIFYFIPTRAAWRRQAINIANQFVTHMS